jgi:hypothetical protein
MKIVIRAFDANGYHKDILRASEQQVHSHDARVDEPTSSIHSGLIGFGGQIVIKEFPEITHFELVIIP